MAASADSATLRLWDSVRQGGGRQHKAEAYVTNMSRTVDSLPKNARKTGDPKAIRRASEVQQIVVDEDFRPANPMVLERSKPRVAPTTQEFVDNGGLWDRLFAKSR
jgi:ABC-type sulfate transport system substrate-binding protein